MKNRAFTLIELLVVIAIIAILAAILFPVFAQAKLAAKKAASLSNSKQIGLSEIIYQNDYDDNFVLSNQDYAASGCPLSASSHCTKDNGGAYANTPALNWAVLLIPYMKTVGLYVDPGTGDAGGYFGGGPKSIPQNWNHYTQYGYNYPFLSPMGTGTPPTGNGQATSTFGLGRSSTQSVKPAETVMFTTAQGFSNGTTASSQFNQPDSGFASPPGSMQWLLPAQDRVVIVSKGCFSGTAGFWTCGWTYNTGIGGPVTADVRVLSPYNGGNVTWVDGHAKAMTAGALAAGTDFGTSTTSDGSTIYGPTGCVITDLTKYLWSLDGTITDIQ